MLLLGPYKNLQEQKITVNRIYSRATGDARRSLDYNIVVTGVSVFIAFLIGGMGLLSVAAELTQPTGGLLEAVTAVDLNFLGITVIAFFALAWMATAATRTANPAPALLRSPGGQRR